MGLEFDSDCDYDLTDKLEIDALSRGNKEGTLLASGCLNIDRETLTIIMAATGMDYWSILALTILKQALKMISTVCYVLSIGTRSCVAYGN